GIPDIETYLRMSPRAARALRLTAPFRVVLALAPLRRVLERAIERRIRGPEPGRRARTRTQIWGEARAADGSLARLAMRAPEGYSLTAEAAVTAVKRLLLGGVPAGAMTPAL